MKRKGCFAVAVTGALVAALALPGWWLLIKHRRLGDDAPLPSGPVALPEIRAGEDTSRIRLGMRMSITSLEGAANQFIPLRWPIDPKIVGAEVEGNVGRGSIDFYRKAANRLGINMNGSFNGSASWGIWTVRSATVSFDGSTASLELDRDWNWKCAPDLCATVTEMNVDWAPDALGKWIANGFLVPDMQAKVGNFGLVPLKSFVEAAWSASNIDLQVMETPRIRVGCRPVAASIGGPLLDEQTSDLVVNLGIDLESWCGLGAEGSPVDNSRSTSLPPLKQADTQQETTELSIPLLLRISDLAALFQPQTFEVNGGSVRVDSLELSENEGMIHARLHADVKLPPSRWEILAPDSAGITLLAGARPSCDPLTGEIALEDLALTPQSDSILVGLLGKGAGAILREQVSLLLPPLSGGLKNKWESTLNHEVGGFISSQMQEWAKTAPGFAPQILATKPEVRNIRVLPTRVAAETGHLVVILRASADLSMRVQ